MSYHKPLDLRIWEGGTFGRNVLPGASPETGLLENKRCG
jgi:hypothetical protein